MSLVKYMRENMQIRRPFLFLLSSALSFGIGASGMYMLEHQKVSTLRERVAETQLEVVRKESEWSKKLKEATKKITLIKPDGTQEIVETTSKDVDSAGRIVLDTTKLSQSVRLLEETVGDTSWRVSGAITPVGFDFGSFKNYNYSFGVEKKIFSNFSIGPKAFYLNDSFYFGIGFTFSF